MKKRIPIEDLKPFIKMALIELDVEGRGHALKRACEAYTTCSTFDKSIMVKSYNKTWINITDILYNAMLLQAELTRSIQIGVCDERVA